MSDIKHKIRFELIRNNTITNTIEPKMGSGNDDLEISTSSSIDSFPTFTFKSLNPELNSLFMSYSKNDVVRLSVAHDGEDIFVTLFEGEFSRKQMKYEPDFLTLNIESIHSFFRLSLLEISSDQYFKNVTFDDFVKELMEISGISIKINISPDIAIIPITGISRHTNLFRLFKEVCLMIGASVVFNTNNTVDIESRSSRINKIQRQEVRKIVDKDIITFESTDQIQQSD